MIHEKGRTSASDVLEEKVVTKNMCIVFVFIFETVILINHIGGYLITSEQVVDLLDLKEYITEKKMNKIL